MEKEGRVWDEDAALAPETVTLTSVQGGGHGTPG
jgi:hypothetical protein